MNQINGGKKQDMVLFFCAQNCTDIGLDTIDVFYDTKGWREQLAFDLQ